MYRTLVLGSRYGSICRGSLLTCTACLHPLPARLRGVSRRSMKHDSADPGSSLPKLSIALMSSIRTSNRGRQHEVQTRVGKIKVHHIWYSQLPESQSELKRRKLLSSERSKCRIEPHPSPPNPSKPPLSTSTSSPKLNLPVSHPHLLTSNSRTTIPRHTIMATLNTTQHPSSE